MKYILSLLHFDREKYNLIEEYAIKSNWRIMRHFSGIIAIIFGAMAVLSLFRYDTNETAYIFVGFGLLCMVFFCLTYSKIRALAAKEFITIAFLVMLLLVGIYIGTFITPEEKTLTFIVIMIIVPALYNYRVWKLNTIVGISIVIYISVAYFTQSDEMFRINILNVIPYGIVSMFTTALIITGKLQNMVLQIDNMELVEKKLDSEIRMRSLESFVSDMIKYASSEETPEKVIAQILQYVGQKLCSDRTYIVEKNKYGTYDNTYEWCKEGVCKQRDSYQNIPFDGGIQALCEEHEYAESILIRDIEEYKEKREPLYQLMKHNGVSILATGSIKKNGKVVAFYGVENPSKDMLGDINEQLEMIEFFVTFILTLRDNERRLEYAAHHDQLTGCQNRQALKAYYSFRHDPQKPLGAFMCDVNGLKKVNDTYGHDAGDDLIVTIGSTLMDIFGKDHVYRIGGDEFVSVLPGIDEEEFIRQVQLVEVRLGDRVSIGSSYREKMDIDLDSVIRVADVEMYKKKRKHYEEQRKTIDK